MTAQAKTGEHTSGPWEYRPIEGQAMARIYDASGSVMVAVCIPKFYSPERDDEQAEANARRIVAACNAAHDAGLTTEALESGVVKDMLEALRLALECLDRDGAGSAASVLNTHARAAVAKATGAQS